MLHHGRAALMLETIGGPGRRLGSRDLDHPLGRGINFQIQVDDVTSVYARLQRGNWSIELPLEQRWYRVGDHDAGNEQFVAADPDGYLFRFFRDLGVRCPDSDSGSL